MSEICYPTNSVQEVKDEESFEVRLSSRVPSRYRLPVHTSVYQRRFVYPNPFLTSQPAGEPVTFTYTCPAGESFTLGIYADRIARAKPESYDRTVTLNYTISDPNGYSNTSTRCISIESPEPLDLTWS